MLNQQFLYEEYCKGSIKNLDHVLTIFRKFKTLRKTCKNSYKTPLISKTQNFQTNVISF
jgi:hypothetical protein